MATAKKTPAGNYRCLVFAGYVIKDGKRKRKYESFTAPTKREAEAMAARWANSRTERPSDMTVLQAVTQYIASRENVLSPSTIRGYNACIGRFCAISDKRIRSLTNADVQLWVSGLASTLSPKSVSNTYGLFTAAINFLSPETSFNVKLPSKIKTDYYIPPDEDVKKLLSVIDGELLIAVMLARYYSLRRSEICALRSDDLCGDVLTIRRAVVHNKESGWVTKDIPKTYDSYRYVIIAEPLLNALNQIRGSYITCNPDALMSRFRRAMKRSRIKQFKFHALRHMFATSAALMGVPDFLAAKMGGWSQSSKVLKNVYQTVRDDDLRKQMNRINHAMQLDLQLSQNEGNKKAAE